MSEVPFYIAFYINTVSAGVKINRRRNKLSARAFFSDRCARNVLPKSQLLKKLSPTVPKMSLQTPFCVLIGCKTLKPILVQNRMSHLILFFLLKGNPYFSTISLIAKTVVPHC